MKVDVYGQQVFTENDVCKILMTNPNLEDYGIFLVDSTSAIDGLVSPYSEPTVDIDEFHRINQNTWLMPTCLLYTSPSPRD